MSNDTITAIDVRHYEMFFKIDKSKYKIPSKMFPLKFPKSSRFFLNEDSEKIEDEKLKKIFDACQFNMGRCYTNTEMICKTANQFGINVEYYSGWMFMYGHPPLHHAWAVYNGYVLDGGVLVNMMEYFNKNPLTEDIAKNREIVADYTANELKRPAPNSEKHVFGYIPKGILYFGVPDSMDNAKETFRKLANDFPNHPSYRGGHNMRGFSKTQEIIHNKLNK